MSPTFLRLPVAAVLVVILALSLFPPAGASANSGPSQSSAQNSRQRRGKNGQSARSGASEANRAEAQTSARSSAGQKKSPDDSAASDGQQQALPQGASASSSLDDGGASPSAQHRREPPPFDRPPLGSQSPSQTTSRDTQPSTRSESQNSSASGAPPVLRRPRDEAGAASGDSDYQRDESKSRGGPPVLQRPSDQRTRSEQEPQSGRDSSPGVRQNNEPAQDSSDDEPIRLESTMVNIPLLVSDRSGRFVPQLSQRDFLLYEDGSQQEIAFFGSEEVPFNVVLLLDVSPSVQGSLEDIQDAAIAFVRQLRSQDRVMVVSFDRRANYLTGFTSNRRELEMAIRSTMTGSGTSVYDSVYEAVARRLRNVEGRKALILFSDGEDTTSNQASYDDAVEIVTESDVLVYGLRYPSSGRNIRVDPWPRNPVPQIPIPWPWPWPRRRRGPFIDSTLRMMSGATGPLINASSATASPDPQRWPRGGRNGDFMIDITEAGGGPVYDAEQISDLSRLATRIAEELRHVYVISYYPTNPLSNGGYRSIRVRVKGRDDIAVRHRKGYNARDVGNKTTT